MSLEYYIMEKADYSKINKLRTLHNPKTFWDDVRRFTKACRSDHSLRRWLILAEARYGEITTARTSFYYD